jgi:hypothetical protein
MQCDLGFRLHTSLVTVSSTSKSVHVQPSDEADKPWPLYGDEIMARLKDDLGAMTFSDSCNSHGCSLGTSLVFNINTLRRQVQDSSNATTLKGTEEFVASVLDNTLINRLLTRFISNAPEPTERVAVVVGVPSVVFGDYKFIVIVGVLNAVIVLAYLVEFARTWAWQAMPPLDIMNDSEVIVAAFEGGRSFERGMKLTSLPAAYDRRLSAKSMLSLQYDVSKSGKPILLPHFTGLDYISVPVEDPATDRYMQNAEHIPLVEGRRL